MKNRLALLCLPISLALSACISTFTEPTVEVGRVQSPDGLSLAYEIRGSGSPTLLFIHGWCCNRGQWRETLAAFSDEHRVVAFDLGGHGDSDLGREEWTLDAFAGDVEAIIRQLQLSSVILVGHSMGGPVACLAAARQPDHVRAVIGVETLHSAGRKLTEADIAPAIAAFDNDYEGAFRQMIAASMGASVSPAVTDRIIRDAIATKPEVTTGVLRGYPNVSLADILAATPTLVLCINSASGQLPTDVEGNTALNVGYSCLLLEGTGHFPMLENPPLFQEQLRIAIATVMGR